MSDPRLEPALTPENWKQIPRIDHVAVTGNLVYVGPRYRDRPGSPAIVVDPRTEHAAVIALANAALPDPDPRKITRDRIAQLRRAALALEIDQKAFDVDNRQYATTLREFADALESYLQPATP